MNELKIGDRVRMKIGTEYYDSLKDNENNYRDGQGVITSNDHEECDFIVEWTEPSGRVRKGQYFYASELELIPAFIHPTLPLNNKPNA